jgi:RNA polymerase sigma factor (sigma-70 family)
MTDHRATSGSGRDSTAEQKAIADARAGSREARDALIQRFQKLVLHYLRKRMGDRLKRFSSEEDLLQEVLMRGVQALEKMPDGARPADFRGVLLQHARWVLLERGRQSGDFLGESIVIRHDPDGCRSGSQPEVVDGAATWTGLVAQADQDRWLRALVLRLDEKHASVVQLYLDGRSYGEIAQELGISEANARKRLQRAARSLGQRVRKPGSSVGVEPGDRVALDSGEGCRSGLRRGNAA